MNRNEKEVMETRKKRQTCPDCRIEFDKNYDCECDSYQRRFAGVRQDDIIAGWPWMLNIRSSWSDFLQFGAQN